jgi:hypothetical protein
LIGYQALALRYNTPNLEYYTAGAV